MVPVGNIKKKQIPFSSSGADESGEKKYFVYLRRGHQKALKRKKYFSISNFGKKKCSQN